MTIIMTAVSPGGIVLAGEGRAIAASKEEIEVGFQNNRIDHDLHSDNEEKIYLLADKFGLAYSGFSFKLSGWNVQNDVNELDYCARNGAGLKELAETFNSWVKEAATDKETGIIADYGFYLCGYEKGKPKQICYRGGKDVTDEKHIPAGWRTDVKEFPKGCYEWGFSMAGKTDLIRDFIKDKRILWHTFPLRDIVELIELLMAVGIKGARYFDGYQQVSGGKVDILVISPAWTGFVKHKMLGLLEVV